MHSELTNLLPPERQRAFRRDYFVRLSVIATILFTMLTVVAAVLLIPTYIFLLGTEKTQNTHLTNIKSTIASSDEGTLSAQLTFLSSSATNLSSITTTHSVSAIMSKILAVSRPGIVLSGFSYSPNVVGNSGKLAISGIAVTRDSLRNYQLAIQSAPFASTADLPVSSYAKDADISFTITVTIAP